MQPDQQSQSKSEAKVSPKDISPILKGWDYEGGTINVRKITGLDGSLKLQMRLDLGLLQMEMTGRPDGVRPHGCESLLDYFEQLLAEHQKRHGTDIGFTLDSAQCQQLREEAGMYYYRYLSLFVLEDFAAVVRDTARNIRVLDLCGQFAEEEQDRLVLEQYRPYILMMLARARASIFFKDHKYAEALKAVNAGLEDIRGFFASFGQEQAVSRSNEARVLKRFAKEIKRKLPVDPLEKLQRKLARAIKSEQYEEAARLRDKIAVMDPSAAQLSKNMKNAK